MRQRRKPQNADVIDQAWRKAFGQPSRHELEAMAAQLRKLGFLAWLEPAPASWGDEPGTLALYLPGAVAFGAYSVGAIVEWFRIGGGREPHTIEPPPAPTEEREAALALLAWLSPGRSIPEA